MDLSVHGPHTKDVLLKGELLKTKKKKKNLISDVEVTWFGRRADWAEQGMSVVSRESQIQWVCSQSSQWANNADCWCLGVSPSEGLKICSETMSF